LFIDINKLTIGSLVQSEVHSHKNQEIKWDRLPEQVSNPSARRFQRIMLIAPSMTLYSRDLPRCTYPLGIGYIASLLMKYNYDVEILDVFAEGYYQSTPINENGKFIRYGLSDSSIEDKIRTFKADLVGVSGIFTNQADNIHNVLNLAKKVDKGIITALGGSYGHYFPRACLSDPNLDLVFLGESELTFLLYLEYLNGCYRRDEICGVAYRDNKGEIKVNPGLSLIGLPDQEISVSSMPLDSLPPPAWDKYNMELYFKIKAYQSPYTKGDRVGQIYTSRGCKAHCTFCTTTNFWGNKFRARSPQNVIEELTRLRKEYGVNEFHIQDDNITNNIEHSKYLFKELKNIGLPWATPQGVALWSMDEELLDLMADSGAYQLTFAIESSEQRVLFDLIKKPLNLNRTEHLISHAKKIGLKIHGFFIIGNPPMFGKPGESIEEMKATYRFAKESGFDSASFFAVTPIVGSELLSECLRQGFIDPETQLFQMSYKQGVINVPGLWSGQEVADLAAEFNYEFNKSDKRSTSRKWSANKY